MVDVIYACDHLKLFLHDLLFDVARHHWPRLRHSSKSIRRHWSWRAAFASCRCVIMGPSSAMTLTSLQPPAPRSIVVSVSVNTAIGSLAPSFGSATWFRFSMLHRPSHLEVRHLRHFSARTQPLSSSRLRIHQTTHRRAYLNAARNREHQLVLVDILQVTLIQMRTLGWSIALRLQMTQQDMARCDTMLLSLASKHWSSSRSQTPATWPHENELLAQLLA